MFYVLLPPLSSPETDSIRLFSPSLVLITIENVFWSKSIAALRLIFDILRHSSIKHKKNDTFLQKNLRISIFYCNFAAVFYDALRGYSQIIVLMP